MVLFIRLFYLTLLLVLISGTEAGPPGIETEIHSWLPEAVTNNAVAAVNYGGSAKLFSFMGLKSGKSSQHTTLAAFQMNVDDQEWQKIPGVPGRKGRLAGTAVGAGDVVYVFGGYTVAEDHSEKSIPDVVRYNPQSRTYSSLAPIPVAVDDAVSVLYKERYIYLISGWHDTDNVNLVQVYDIVTDEWFRASDFPGTPVFGHSGGLAGNKIIISDGVKKVEKADGSYIFAMSDENYMGTIDPDNPENIDWQLLPAHPGKPLYRMASTGSERHNAVVFAGGSENPYNYNGIGYNGRPSEPSSILFAWSFQTNTWVEIGHLEIATMDHRGLIEVEDEFYIIGGMLENQIVSRKVLKFSLPELN